MPVVSLWLVSVLLVYYHKYDFSTLHLFSTSNTTNLFKTPQYTTRLLFLLFWKFIFEFLFLLCNNFMKRTKFTKKEKRKAWSKGIIKDFSSWIKEKKNNTIKENWILLFNFQLYQMSPSFFKSIPTTTIEILTRDFLFLEGVAQNEKSTTDQLQAICQLYR